MSSVQFRGFNSFTPVLPSGPTAPYTSAPVDEDEEDKKKSSNRGSKSGISIGGLDSSMIKILTEHGLASDVRWFMELMDNVIMSAYDPLTGNTNIAAYKLLLPKLAEIKNEYELFQKAYDKISDDQATMNEVAVTTSGLVFVINPNAKTPLEYLVMKRVGDLDPLDVLVTNGELARFRLKDPAAAFNTNYTTTLENGISMQSILDYIKNAIAGSGSLLETDNTLFLNADGQTLKGIEILKNYLKGDPALKTKVNLKSQEAELKLAFSFLVSTLPTNMGVVLSVHARKSLQSPTEMLYNYILSKNNSESSVDYDIVGGLPQKDASESEGSQMPLNNAALFFLGKTPSHGFRISNGTRSSYVGQAHVGNLTTAEGRQIPANSKLSDVTSGEFHGILDTNNITMGQEIVYDPDRVRVFDSTVEGVELPIDKDMLDADRNGVGRAVIRPDLNRLYIVDAIETWIKDNNIEDEEQINELYTNARLEPKYVYNKEKLKWELNSNAYIRFAVIHAYADTKALSDLVDSNKDFLLEFNDQQKPLYQAKFQELINNKKVGEIPDDIVEGNIYIPIKDSLSQYSNAILGAFLTGTTNLKVGQVQTLMDALGQHDAKKATNYTKPSDSIASLLNE